MMIVFTFKEIVFLALLTIYILWWVICIIFDFIENRRKK